MNNLSQAYEKTFSCVQCGMCLPSCPTYLTLKEEKHSPRGRINLLKYYLEKKLDLDDIREGFEVCLGCMACQTVCPTGVDYGYIHHSAIELLKENEKKHKPFKYYTLKKSLNISLNKKISLKVMKQTLSTMQNIIPKNNMMLNILSEKNKNFYNALPDINKNMNQIITKKNESKMKIAYFKGCIMNVMFEEINNRAIEILEKHNVEVITIPNEVCCGALQNHAGYSDEAKQLAIKNIEIFENVECDYIVNAIGGCGATLKEYPLFFQDEVLMQQRAQQFSDKNVDISVILSKLDLKLENPLNYNVTYQPSCHLTNVQKITLQPEKLIMDIPGINYQPLKEKEICCGSAGIYNIVQYENSMKVLDRKMKNVEGTFANVIATSNPGCYLQMQLGITREGLTDKIKVKHIVDLIYESSIGGI